MKKEMVVVTIVTALSFLVSLIADAPVAAKAVSKEESKAKSVTPAQVPPPAPGESTVPKAQFWDLALDHCVLKGISISMNPCTSKTVTVKVGQPLAGTCFYKAITLPKANITKADAAYWGWGNFTYMIGYFIVNSLNAGKLFKKEETR